MEIPLKLSPREVLSYLGPRRNESRQKPAETLPDIGKDISVHFWRAMKRLLRHLYVIFKNALKRSLPMPYTYFTDAPKCPKCTLIVFIYSACRGQIAFAYFRLHSKRLRISLPITYGQVHPSNHCTQTAFILRYRSHSKCFRLNISSP